MFGYRNKKVEDDFFWELFCDRILYFEVLFIYNLNGYDFIIIK